MKLGELARIEAAQSLVSGGLLAQPLDLGAKGVALLDRIKTRLRPCVPLDSCSANHAYKVIALVLKLPTPLR